MTKPNILFLMMDQCRADVFDDDHPCRTPHLDELKKCGVRLTKAYTSNPVCSPARASLMTGLLPTRHKVRWVTHTVDQQLAEIDKTKPHWAQSLQAAGYKTGYFGKWHVDNACVEYNRGWDEFIEYGEEKFKSRYKPRETVKTFEVKQPGYNDARLYGRFEHNTDNECMGVACQFAREWLDDGIVDGENPWCCFISVIEPHDPFNCTEEVFQSYDVDALPLSETQTDDLTDRPKLYRRCQDVFADMTDEQHREARACYYANITEIDEQFGRVINELKEKGVYDNTIIVVTSDHGEHLGDHGIYTKNIHPGEGVYRIPLFVSGPGVKESGDLPARVGIHAIGSTILELCGLEALPDTDEPAFTGLLNGDENVVDYQYGYAENEGSRWSLTQRVVYCGDWKLIVNGFDDDELYHLSEDPNEVNNRIEDPSLEEQRKECYRYFWKRIKATGDHTLNNSAYLSLRLLPYGPGITEEELVAP